MKPGFKVGALSLALMIACATSAYAAKSNQMKSNNLTSSPWYSMSSGYPMTFAGTVPTSNAWKWSPTAPVMPTNYDQFMVWAEDINAGKSNEPLLNCWNNMLCVSGLTDLDLFHYNRHGNGFGPAAAVSGTGVRPQFGNSETGFMGSINNANFLIDYKFIDLVRLHADIAYINGGVKTDTYAWQPSADWLSSYWPGAGIKMDEFYAVISSNNTYPLYAKIGKFYLDFGQYRPNGYGLPTITPSLTQLMTQVRTGGAQVGFALQNGLYASATWSMSQFSLLGTLRVADQNPARNYSARVGMMRQYEDAYFNINASYIWDIRDADYLANVVNVQNTYVVNSVIATGTYYIRRQHAYAVHADGKYMQWGGGIEGAAVTGPLNPYNPHSTLWTAGANVNYSFPTLGHDSSLDLSYQVARNAAYIIGAYTFTSGPYTGFVVGPFSNELPKNRIQGTYTVKLVKHFNLGLQWVHDKDFAQPAGTNLTSDIGLFRIDFEF